MTKKEQFKGLIVELEKEVAMTVVGPMKQLNFARLSLEDNNYADVARLIAEVEKWLRKKSS